MIFYLAIVQPVIVQQAHSVVKMPLFEQGSRFEYSEAHGPTGIRIEELPGPAGGLVAALGQLALHEVRIRAIVFCLWSLLTTTRRHAQNEE